MFIFVFLAMAPGIDHDEEEDEEADSEKYHHHGTIFPYLLNSIRKLGPIHVSRRYTPGDKKQTGNLIGPLWLYFEYEEAEHVSEK
jgi:hypothetical protein